MEIQLKTATRISICTLNSFKLPSNLTKTIKNLLVFRKSLKNGSNNLYFYPYAFDERKKYFFYLTSLSRRGSVIPSTPTLPNINLTETIKIYLLHENWIKNTSRISFCTINPFKLLSNQIHVWPHFPVVVRSIRQPQPSAVSVL